MIDDEPIEPSAVLAADGTRVPYRSGRAPTAPARALRSLLPALQRAAARGPLVTASVMTVAAAVKAAEVAYRLASQVASAAADQPLAPRAVPGRIEISWTRIEIRWPG
jgi:hypothetical protein